MDSVICRKLDLAKVMTENRDLHRKIFEEAVVGYKAEAIRLLNEHIKRIEAGRIGLVQVMLPTPQDHTKDYDRILKMLQYSVEDQIELSAQEFSQYVMDNWSWKREFIGMSQTYNSTTGLKIDISDL